MIQQKMRFKWIINIFLIAVLVTTPSKGLMNNLEMNDANDKSSNNIDSQEVMNLESISLDQTLAIPRISNSKVEIDGKISLNEYGESFTDSRTAIKVNWEHNSENLSVGIIAPSTGWVAWGAGSEMNNSNMIMGGLIDTSLYCIDMIGVGRVLPKNDTDNGGNDDIIECASTEDSASTTLEFIFPLDSGDILEPAIEMDTDVEMFFAFSASDDIASNHILPGGHTNILSVQLEAFEDYPELDIDEFDKSIPLILESNIVVDGVISESEYSTSFTDQLTGMDVYWEHNSIEFKIGLVAPGTGWVSLGIGPNMLESTMYMGGVENDATYCVDLDGLADWFHEEDGTNDIIDCAASETEDQTTLEFTIPMNTTDISDQVLEVQTVYQMFLGYHESSDDRTQIHTAHSDVFTVLVMPEAQSIETFMTFLSDTIIEFNETIYFEIVLSDENGSLVDVPVVFFMESQFGEIIIAMTTTDSEGKTNTSYSNPYLLNEHTFGARSLETVSVESGEVFAYQSSEFKQEIMFMEKIEYDERAEFVRFSRIGLIGIFWLVGIIIWGSFVYVYYQLYQIFKARNDEVEELEKMERSDKDRGGVQ